MRITLEQVEALRKKINCDYQTAEKALRKSKGNINAAILYLKKMQNKKTRKAIVIIQEMMNKLFSFNLLIFKHDKKVFNFPIILLGMIIWIMSIPLPIILSIGVLAALSEFNFEIVDRNENNDDEKVVYKYKPNSTKEDNQNHEINNEIIQEDNETQDLHTEDIHSIMPDKRDEQHDDDDDGFNQIIIE